MIPKDKYTRAQYKSVAQDIANVIKRCKKHYGDDWAEIRDHAWRQLQQNAEENLSEKGLSLSNALHALDNDDEETAMVLVAAAYDPDTKHEK